MNNQPRRDMFDTPPAASEAPVGGMKEMTCREFHEFHEKAHKAQKKVKREVKRGRLNKLTASNLLDLYDALLNGQRVTDQETDTSFAHSYLDTIEEVRKAICKKK